MSSGIFTTVTLDPFYQQFLRGHFNDYDIVFNFPKGHDLRLRLEAFLTPPPPDFVPLKPAQYTDDTFLISIPYMEHKNPQVYFYLSEYKQKLFRRRITAFFKDIWHEYAADCKSDGFLKTEIAYMFLEDYYINYSYYERIIREYRRYLNAEKVKQYRKKIQKNHVS